MAHTPTRNQPTGDFLSHSLAVGCHYFLPSLRSPSQPKNVTVLLPVLSYTAWGQSHIGVNNLRKVVMQLWPVRMKHSLLSASPTRYHNATVSHTLLLFIVSQRSQNCCSRHDISDSTIITRTSSTSLLYYKVNRRAEQSNHSIDGSTYDIQWVDVRLDSMQQSTETHRLDIIQPDTQCIVSH